MEDPEFRDRPTPKSVEAIAFAKERPSFFERLLAHWKLLAILIAIGLVIAAVSGVLLWRSGGGGTTEPSIETPPSLEQLAQQYPELADLLNDPTLGSVYKDFLVAYESGGVDAARELAAKRGLLNDRDEIRITLVLDSAEYVPALVEELQGVGITVEGSYKERINVGVPMDLIEQLAEEQGTSALFEQLTQMDHIIRLELAAPRQSDALQAQAVQGEGVSVTGADKWHAAGLAGQSIRIGVLDLGFDGYRDLLGTELPESVVSTSFIYGKEPDASGEVHGTACAEIVHEMAPEAELYLAAYDSSLVSMGQAVDWLLSQNVQIISNSTSGVVGPMDGSDESARMVDDAVSRGVLWVNSSGNAAEEHYRGAFTDTDGDGLHEFPDGTELMGLYVYAPNLTIALNWDDWRNLTEDYNLYLFSEEGDLIASSEDMQTGLPGQAAAEVLIGTDVPEGVYFVSFKGQSTTRPGTLDLYTVGASLEFPVAEHSLGSPADAVGALAVGAAEARDDSLAPYSSQGPSNDGRLKPEISAPAGVSSATYAPETFEGTSASTPHVAGAAGLVWSAFPDYSAEEVRDYLEANALDLGPAGPDNGFGYGRLQLPAPPAQVAPTPTELPTTAPLPTEVVEPTLEVVPTQLPELTVPAFPTLVPEPTVVALVPEPVEKPLEEGTSREVSVMVGILGLCGGAVALAGGALLLVAFWRSPRRAVPGAAHPPAPPAEPRTQPPEHTAPGALLPRPPDTAAKYGLLVGAGRAPAVLGPGPTFLGRGAENDIVLDSPQVSRRHARIECAGGRCMIEDMGSTNGLFVNGKRVSRAMLSPGDRLRFGDLELAYQATGAPPAAPWAEAPSPGGAPARAWLEMGANRYPLSRAGTALGRSRDNDIYLDDRLASRWHARIDVQQGAFVISDLGSANGTFVNGQRIQRQPLRNGDEIRIGDSRLYFRG
jgi:pSer/pThr/pTyr-binding forkhead associated (FHA) protein/subtilisin family serine protease